MNLTCRRSIPQHRVYYSLFTCRTSGICAQHTILARIGHDYKSRKAAVATAAANNNGRRCSIVHTCAKTRLCFFCSCVSDYTQSCICIRTIIRINTYAYINYAFGVNRTIVSKLKLAFNCTLVHTCVFRRRHTQTVLSLVCCPLEGGKPSDPRTLIGALAIRESHVGEFNDRCFLCQCMSFLSIFYISLV